MNRGILLTLALSAILSPVAFAQNQDEMVLMRDGISCQLQGVSYELMVGPGGRLVNTAGSVNKLLCAFAGAVSKDVPLSNKQINNGIITTNDFGNIRLDFTNSLTSNGFSMYMRSADQDKLVAFLKP